jgi:hypothetical protein
MVLFFNFLPIIVLILFIISAYVLHSKKKLTIGKSMFLLVTCFTTLILLNAITPSYLPKGKSQGLSNPVFEKSTAEITDRNRKPEMTETERKSEFSEKFNAVEQATKKP